jgi:hypothetical protein
MNQPDLPPPSWGRPGARPPAPPPASTPIPGDPPVTVRRPNAAVVVITFALLGGFVWLIVGLVGYSALSGFGPRVTEDAQILSVERDFGTGTSSAGGRDPTLWVEGTTESGRTWRMASDDAYEVATTEGYPMDVEVVISTWTGNTLALRGDGIDVDRSGGVAKVGWLVATLVVAAGALLGAWGLARKESLLAAVSYLVLSPLWLWLGLLVMRAIRT